MMCRPVTPPILDFLKYWFWREVLGLPLFEVLGNFLFDVNSYLLNGFCGMYTLADLIFSKLLWLVFTRFLTPGEKILSLLVFPVFLVANNFFKFFCLDPTILVFPKLFYVFTTLEIYPLSLLD
jgi:hypothetical protein